MKSRFGPGYYLACTKYPKCKGKAQVSAELQRKIDAALAAPPAPPAEPVAPPA
jgi:DNA topoisomerase-1